MTAPTGKEQLQVPPELPEGALEAIEALDDAAYYYGRAIRDPFVSLAQADVANIERINVKAALRTAIAGALADARREERERCAGIVERTGRNSGVEEFDEDCAIMAAALRAGPSA